MPNTSIAQDVRRRGRELTNEEFEVRLDAAPERFEWDGGIFTSSRERLVVLGMSLEVLGTDAAVRFGPPDAWEGAVAARREACGDFKSRDRMAAQPRSSAQLGRRLGPGANQGAVTDSTLAGTEAERA